MSGRSGRRWGDKAHVKITLNHGASQKELLTKLKVNKMFMSGTKSFIWFRIWLNNIYTRNRGAWNVIRVETRICRGRGLGNKFKHVHINFYFDFCPESRSHSHRHSHSRSPGSAFCSAHLVVQFYELWNPDIMTEDLLTVCVLVLVSRVCVCVCGIIASFSRIACSCPAPQPPLKLVMCPAQPHSSPLNAQLTANWID